MAAGFAVVCLPSKTCATVLAKASRSHLVGARAPPVSPVPVVAFGSFLTAGAIVVGRVAATGGTTGADERLMRGAGRMRDGARPAFRSSCEGVRTFSGRAGLIGAVALWVGVVLAGAGCVSLRGSSGAGSSRTSG
jgi:hypothetical protein